MTTTPAIAPPMAAQADVIVVGAQPEGSAAAYHHTQAGLDARFLRNTHSPRSGGSTDRVINVLTKVTPAA